MKCTSCQGLLEVLRLCRRVRMRCSECGREFQLHEVADQLDPETEKVLEQYNSVIYD